MSEFTKGDRVRFKKASVANHYTVLFESSGLLTLEGPHRRRHGVHPDRLELVPRRKGRR